MRNETFGDIAHILTQRRRHRVWQKIVSVLSCVVVFCVIYALILPALTLEKTLTCEKQEHIHTAECYQTAEATEVLTCQLEAHTHSEECFNTQQITPLAEGVAASTTPMSLDSYITAATLSYRVGTGEWQSVPQDQTTGTELKIPGDAELKLEISYANIHVDDLKKAGLQVTYTLPKILRSPTGTGQINDSSNQKMGTMTVENSVVTLTFDETWLNLHHAEQDVITGTFHVQSQIDLTEAEKDPSMTIAVGKVNIALNFESDIIAQHAEVKIQKTDPVAKHIGNADYLEYTLTVTAGQDGAPNVVVKDDFTDKSLILGYVGISADTPAVTGVAGPVETGAPAGKGGSCSMNGTTMEWNIGSMEPNEKRTLTYRVKLKDGYLGGKAPTNPVVNTAKLFCSNYERGHDTGTFTPKAQATMSKVAGDFVPDTDGSGGGTITYTIWIQAKDTNTYTLTNVKIWDALDGSISGGGDTRTNAEYLKHTSYVADSFRLYDGGVKDQKGDSGLTPQGGTPVTPVFQKKADGTTDNTYFISCDVGTLAPGQSKTLIYKVHVGPGVFPVAGNEAPRIKNRAQIHAGDSTLGNEAALNSYNENIDIQKKVWSNKVTGVEQELDTKVTVSGRVFAANGSLIGNQQAEFTAPAGSYLYQVFVNEAGDWDVSQATMTDQLQSEYSTYIGYVRVDAYNVDASGNQTLADTVWLDAGGKTNFSFTPSSAGWTGKQVYKLTYYTHVDVGGASLVNVANEFIMQGNVGIGDAVYWMERAYVSVSNTVVGSNSFSVSKYSWYYEPSKVDQGEYANGTIYWYIQVDGTVIPADTYLKDLTSYVPQYIYADSMVGLYTGNMGDRSISSYDDLEELLATNKLTRLAESSYDTPVIDSYRENGKTFPTMTVRLKESIRLNAGESLFLIIKMEPSGDPAELTGTGYNTYKNKVQSSYNGENWVEWESEPTMVLYGSNGISKDVEKVSTWNGTQETVVSPADGTADPAALTGLENGTYVFWKVQLNYTGRLHGSYCVEELIPAGMKLAYVECTGVGKGYTDAAKPSCAQKPLEEGWTENQRSGVRTTYYYTNGQTARWYVDGLETDANPTKPTHTVDFLVVCRVTDADALLGGKKTFQNEVKLLRGSKLIDSSGSSVIVESHTLSKEELYAPETDSTKVPFVITLNPLGEDLVSGAETLSLLDTLSDTLKLDIDSIQVKRTGTDTIITDWESSVKGQTLTLTLPDGIPLTVSYSTWINARPGDRISISNDAHWEGYSSYPGGAVAPDAFDFNVSGWAGTSDPVSIKITKRDENHLSTYLGGAVFSLSQVTVNADGTFAETPLWQTDVIPDASSMAAAINVSDAKGQLAFGVASDQTMESNTIYCLRETQAPAGYVLDSTPYYFVIAQKETQTDGTEAYPTFPDGVYVHYLSPQYSYNALNHKGQITIQKEFLNPGGNPCDPVFGTYTFGLYNTADGSGSPLQTATIIYSAEDKVADKTADKTAVFRDLPIDQTYYVFELDDDGNPVLEGGNLSNRFVVRYRYSEDTNGAALTAQKGDQAVTVTNWVNSPKLPDAGGIGTTRFYVLGSILLAGAAVLLISMISRRKKPD